MRLLRKVKMFHHKFLFSFILMVLTGYLQAQVYYFENYNVKEGLAQSKVYTIIQDNMGYIWLGTENGVSRFDGNTFINYTTENNMASNGVRVIYQDSDNRLWFGHIGGGITVYFNHSFREVTDKFNLKNDITSFAEDKNGKFWITSHGSGALSFPLNEFGTDSLQPVIYKGKQGLSDRIFSVSSANDSTLFFLTDVGIKKYFDRPQTFDFYRLKGLPKFFMTTTMYEDSKGNQWFGTHNGGLYKYYPENETFKVFDVRDGLSHNFISTIAEDSKGNIWAGTWGGGITRFSGDSMLVFDTHNGLHGSKIQAIIEDREGNMLIGTHENGLDIFKGDYFIIYNEENGLPGQQVLSLYQDKNDFIWFGTNEGIALLDPAQDSNHPVAFVPNDEPFIKDQMKFIKKDIYGDLWIGTGNYGVVKYNTEKNRFIYQNEINRIIARNHNIITALETDAEGNVWIGTIGGLIYYEIQNKHIEFLTQRSGLASNDISALFYDSKGTLWIGCKDNGVTRIKGSEFEILKRFEKITISSFAEDKQGLVWLGSEGLGLFAMNNDSVIHQFRTSHGLWADYITAVDVDKNNNIYIGSSRGLNIYNQEKDKIWSYSEKEGFTGIEVKNNATLCDNQGNLWFGTIHGAMKYIPERDIKKRLEPLTYITDLTVNLKERELTPNLELNYSEKSVSFQYTSISISNPSAVRYKVMLEGADDNWRPETDQTFVTYSPLPPGKYTFKVKAKNNMGIWNDEPASYSFQINPPFWQTWWFYVLVGIVVITFIVAYIKIRERKLIVEKRILEEKVRERTAEVMQKNDELAQKNKDITDSIRYAQRIQDAVLPTTGYVNQLLPECFILFKPRDIVSGDFYWISGKNDRIIFAAADCTGHGVPGAFMSMLGISFLNEIVNKKESLKANEILNELREYVITSMKQTGKRGETQDGMDLALCIIDKNSNKIQYSGAYNPLYMIRNQKLTVIKANRMPVGYYFKETRAFKNHELDIQKGDTFYMFSDGYVDQFGGEDNKKFNSKQYKSLILENHMKPMPEQKTILENTFNNWKGTREQLDDILVVGFRI